MADSTRIPIALTIAGSDSGGGAGIQADLKSFAANGVYGASVLTLVTAQNTQGVSAVHVLPADLVRRQIAAVFTDFTIGAVKTGALGTAEMIQTVAKELASYEIASLVVDPVMISKHGYALLAPDAVEALRRELLPLATVVTPNLPEARALTGLREGGSREWMLEAASKLLTMGPHAVVLKGGHRADDPVDLLLTGDGPTWLEGQRIDQPHTHGTGCTYSAALAAQLLRGAGLAEAARAAKKYVSGAIAHARVYGQGINPVDHFWHYPK